MPPECVHAGAGRFITGKLCKLAKIISKPNSYYNFTGTYRAATHVKRKEFYHTQKWILSGH
jgi:hypothetical protein